VVFSGLLTITLSPHVHATVSQCIYSCIHTL